METPQTTRERLLDAAEVLFAEKGVSGASLRDITKLAKVNLAAVNYHFGSKEGLLREVLGRRLNPINDQRLRLLDELKAKDSVSVEQVLETFIKPLLDSALAPTSHFIQLMARMHHAPDAVVSEVLGEVFGPVMQRYLRAFTELLPELSPSVLFLRMQFLIGAMVHSLFVNCDARVLHPNAPVTKLDDASYLQQFVAFCAAGLRHA
jgi:AcrR family transcriptional regulator